MTERIDMIDTVSRRRQRLVAAAAAAAAAVLLLAGCGGSAKPSSASSSSSGAGSGVGAAGPGSAQGFAGGGARPAASGQIAALSGNSMEVQDPATGQVTVTFTAKTTFTQTVTVPASAIVAGDCVTAVAASSSASASASAAATAPATASTTAAPPTAITATMVAVSTPRSGSCTGPRTGSGPQQTPPSGAPSGLPSGVPSGLPSGGRTGGTFGRAVFGQVSSVSGSSLVVHEAARGTQPARDVTVTTDAATVITEQRSASAATLQVGKCVSAAGTTDSTGAVAATRIAISTPTANGCTSTFGRFGGRGGFNSGSGATTSGG